MKKLTVAALAVTTLLLAVPLRMKQANFLCVQVLQRTSNRRCWWYVRKSGWIQRDNNTQLGLTFTYMATDNIGVDYWQRRRSAIKSAPGRPAILNRSPSAANTDGAVVFWWCQHKFRPYVGAGINYTTFFDNGLTIMAKRRGFPISVWKIPGECRAGGGWLSD